MEAAMLRAPSMDDCQQDMLAPGTMSDSVQGSGTGVGSGGKRGGGSKSHGSRSHGSRSHGHGSRSHGIGGGSRIGGGHVGRRMGSHFGGRRHGIGRANLGGLNRRARKQTYIQGRIYGRRGNMCGASLAYRMGARAAQRADARRKMGSRARLRITGTRRSYMSGGYYPFWINGRRYLHYRHRWQLYYQWNPTATSGADLTTIIAQQHGTVDPSRVMRQALLPPDSANFAFVPFEDDEAPDGDDYPPSMHHLLNPSDFQAASQAVWNAIHSQDHDVFPGPEILPFLCCCCCIGPCIYICYGVCGKEQHDLEIQNKIQAEVASACAEWTRIFHTQRMNGISLAVVDQEGVEGLAFFVAPYNSDGSPNPNWSGPMPPMSQADQQRCQDMIKVSMNPSAPPIDNEAYERLLEEEADQIIAKGGDSEPNPNPNP